MFSELLLHLTREIGVDDDEGRNAELPHRYYLEHELTAGTLRQLTVETLASLQQNFGKALNLEIGIKNALPQVEIDHARSSDIWKSRLEELQKRDPDLALQLILEIDKDELIHEVEFEPNQDEHVLLFFFRERLLRILNGPAVDIEHYLFPVPFKRTLILLDNAPSFLFQGALLTIASIDRVATNGLEPSPLSSRVRTRMQHYYSARDHSLNWTGFHLNSLTPLHFIGSWEGEQETALAESIARQLLRLCIFYTANRVSLDGGIFQAVFASTDNVITLALVGNVDLISRISTLNRLALWPYTGQESDRLTFFQNIVARSLTDDDDPQKNFRTFVKQLRQLLNDARWHNRVFLESKIESHFQQIEVISEYASDTANEIAGQLDAMTRGLVEGLLGAVGVIVLTLLGATLNDKSGGLLIRWGMWAYILHLLLFQGFYRLGSIFHTHQLIKQDASERHNTYSDQIGQNRIKQLWQPFIRRVDQFHLWFRVTLVVYAAVILILLLLSFYVPAEIAALQVTPTPTILPTPSGTAQP